MSILRIIEILFFCWLIDTNEPLAIVLILCAVFGELYIRRKIRNRRRNGRSYEERLQDDQEEYEARKDREFEIWRERRVEDNLSEDWDHSNF